MPVETGSWVGDFDITSPTNGEAKKFGDDHLRLIKEWLQNSFAGWDGLIFAYGTEAAGATTNDYVLTVAPAPGSLTNGVYLFIATHANTGAATLKINSLTTKNMKTLEGTALASGNIANGAIVAVFYNGTEFRIITSNGRALLTGSVYTGTQDFTGATITVPTPASGTAPVTRDYMDAVVIAAGNVPDPSAHPDEVLGVSGGVGAWVSKLKASVIKFKDASDATKLLSFDLSGLPTATERTVIIDDTGWTFTDPTDPTKKLILDISAIPTATSRTLTARNRNIILSTPGTEWLQTVTASASSVIDLTGFDSSLFSDYIILLSGVRLSATNADLLLQMKVGGSLQTTLYFGHVDSSGSGAAAYAGAVTSAASSLLIADDFGTDAATGGCDMDIHIRTIGSTAKHHKIDWDGEILTGTGGTTAVKRASGVGGCGAATGALSEIRFLPSSGNIVVGDFKLYGVRAV